MTVHLTTEQIENYAERNLSRAELTGVNEHLFKCETCYQELLSVLQERRFPLEIDLDELAGLKGWHLKGEDLKAYVEGRMDQIDLDYANLHLEECAWCREEVESYSEFSSKLEYYLSKRHAPLKKPPVWNRYYRAISGGPLQVAAAAALVLMLVSATILWSVWRTKVQDQGTRLAETPQPESPLVTHIPSPPQPDLSEPVTNPGGVKAGGSRLSTNRRKVIIGQQEAETELIARDLVMPSVIDRFDRSPVVVRGNGNQSKSFNIISPYTTVISDDRPTFRWTALDGASSYTVSVYDADLNLVQTSEPLTETQWLIRKRLRGGVVYTWIVTALKDGEGILAPALPARAEFKIIEKSELVKLKRRITSLRSHAARGVLYAEAGLLDEAEQEFQVHLTLQPGDERAMKLLQTVKSWRDPKPHMPPSPTTTKPAQ